MAGIQAQERTISQDSLKILLNNSFDEAYAYNYEKAISTSSLIVEEALKNNDYYFAHSGNLRLGSIYLRMKDTTNSLSYYRKSLEYAKLSKQDTLIGEAYNDIGNVYMEVGGPLNLARDNFIKSLEINTRGGKSEKGKLAQYMNIAWVYIKQSDSRNALPFLNKSKKIVDTNQDLHPLYGINLDILRGQYHIQRNNYERAITILKDAADRSIVGNFLKQSTEIHHFLAEAYEKNGDGVGAISSLKKEKEFDTEFNKIIRDQQLQEASARLKLEQYQKELDTARNEQLLADKLTDKSNQLTAVFIAISIIFFLAALAALMLYRSRKKYVKKLNAKNRELIQAKEEAERLSKLKTQFFSTVSHELRTPLYGVIGLSSILLDDPALTTHKDDLKSLKFSADYLLALINDVLTLNKADANGMQLEKSPFKLSLLIKNITDSFSFSLQQNNNKMNVVIDEAIPDNLLGDSVKLSQILMNLVGNAVKFNENGTIEIIVKFIEKTKEDAYRIHFFVKDNGIGIPKEKQDLIFEEFSQVESNNYNYQGTGLGLPIVKKLLAVHNSTIELNSEVGNGAIFSFIINLEENISQIEADFEVVSNSTLNTEASFENVHILIVDDNKINQKVTQKILQAKNFSTSLADDGIQAVTMTQQNNYGLILMDIHMPNMGGVEATKAIRNFNKNIPIIALTAVEIEEARANMIEAGMDDIILKPYDVAQFLTTIFRNLTPKVTR